MRTFALLVTLACATAVEAQTPKTYTPSNPPRPDEQTILNARVISVDAAGHRLTVRGVDVKADGGRDETLSVGAPAIDQLAALRPGMEVLLVLRGQTVVEAKPSVKSGGESGNVVQGSAGTAIAPAPAATPSARRTTRRPAPRAAVTPRPGAASTAGAATAGTAQVAVSPAPPVARPQLVVSPQPLVTPQPVVVQPGPITPGAAGGGVIVPGPTGPLVIGGTSAGGAPISTGGSPVPMGTPFPTPRPVPTPVPVGTPPTVPPAPTIVVPNVRGPSPVLVPADAPTPVPTPATTPSPASTPTPSPAT
jgi:hypothetical protein